MTQRSNSDVQKCAVVAAGWFPIRARICAPSRISYSVQFVIGMGWVGGCSFKRKTTQHTLLDGGFVPAFVLLMMFAQSLAMCLRDVAPHGCCL